MTNLFKLEDKPMTRYLEGWTFAKAIIKRMVDVRIEPEQCKKMLLDFAESNYNLASTMTFEEIRQSCLGAADAYMEAARSIEEISSF